MRDICPMQLGRSLQVPGDKTELVLTRAQTAHSSEHSSRANRKERQGPKASLEETAHPAVPRYHASLAWEEAEPLGRALWPHPVVPLLSQEEAL